MNRHLAQFADALGGGGSNNVGMGSHLRMMHYASAFGKCLLHQNFGYPDGMRTEQSMRLEVARKSAGFDSASAAAEAMGVKVATYVQHENGNRGLRRGVAERYARFFRVKPSWLLFGAGEMEDHSAGPNVRQLQQMIEAAIRQIPAGASIGDWPRLVAPALSDQLEQYRAAGGLRDSEAEAPARGKRAQVPAPTRPNAPAGSRNP